MSAFRESPFTWSCPSEAATAAVALELSADLKPGDIILLQGDLGSGKTSFSRVLIRSLSNDPDINVPSPTFTLLQTYETAKGTIWHFDLYRLKDPDEIFELGWDDARSHGIVLVEWPDKLGPHKPENVITLTLQPVPGQPDARQITLVDTRS